MGLVPAEPKQGFVSPVHRERANLGIDETRRHPWYCGDEAVGGD
jgi:hypothetical protein